jgi:HEAT repeat protein
MGDTMIAPLHVALVALMVVLPAQDRPDPTPGKAGADAEQAADAEDALPVTEPPPPLTPAEQAALDRLIKSLRASNATARAKTEKKVIAMGRGTIPYLMAKCDTDHEGKRAGLVTCLLAVADVRDRELVHVAIEHQWVTARRFGAAMAGRLALPHLLDLLPQLLDDEDEIVRLESALALVSNGRPDGLPTLVPNLRGPWRQRVLAALPGIAGHGTHAPLAKMLEIDKTRERDDPEGATNERLAAVELLHRIGDEAASHLLIRALDDKHNVVQRDAINALRDLLEGQGPMKSSSIFQQINEVKRLKEVWNDR